MHGKNANNTKTVNKGSHPRVMSTNRKTKMGSDWDPTNSSSRKNSTYVRTQSK